MKKPNKDQTIASLRKMNRELLEKNDELRKKIEALEELVIDTKVEYNDNMLWNKEAWEEIE
jgi:hypothetical protein